jgi:hypothetical protein
VQLWYLRQIVKPAPPGTLALVMGVLHGCTSNRHRLRMIDQLDSVTFWKKSVFSDFLLAWFRIEHGGPETRALAGWIVPSWMKMRGISNLVSCLYFYMN